MLLSDFLIKIRKNHAVNLCYDGAIKGVRFCYYEPNSDSYCYTDVPISVLKQCGMSVYSRFVNNPRLRTELMQYYNGSLVTEAEMTAKVAVGYVSTVDEALSLIQLKYDNKAVGNLEAVKCSVKDAQKTYTIVSEDKKKTALPESDIKVLLQKGIAIKYLSLGKDGVIINTIPQEAKGGNKQVSVLNTVKHIKEVMANNENLEQSVWIRSVYDVLRTDFLQVMKTPEGAYFVSCVTWNLKPDSYLFATCRGLEQQVQSLCDEELNITPQDALKNYSLTGAGCLILRDMTAEDILQMDDATVSHMYTAVERALQDIVTLFLKWLNLKRLVEFKKEFAIDTKASALYARMLVVLFVLSIHCDALNKAYRKKPSLTLAILRDDVDTLGVIYSADRAANTNKYVKQMLDSFGILRQFVHRYTQDVSVAPYIEARRSKLVFGVQGENHGYIPFFVANSGVFALFEECMEQGVIPLRSFIFLMRYLLTRTEFGDALTLYSNYPRMSSSDAFRNWMRYGKGAYEETTPLYRFFDAGSASDGHGYGTPFSISAYLCRYSLLGWYILDTPLDTVGKWQEAIVQYQQNAKQEGYTDSKIIYDSTLKVYESSLRYTREFDTWEDDFKRVGNCMVHPLIQSMIKSSNTGWWSRDFWDILLLSLQKEINKYIHLVEKVEPEWSSLYQSDLSTKKKEMQEAIDLIKTGYANRSLLSKWEAAGQMVHNKGGFTLLQVCDSNLSSFADYDTAFNTQEAFDAFREGVRLTALSNFSKVDGKYDVYNDAPEIVKWLTTPVTPYPAVGTIFDWTKDKDSPQVVQYLGVLEIPYFRYELLMFAVVGVDKENSTGDIKVLAPRIFTISAASFGQKLRKTKKGVFEVDTSVTKVPFRYLEGNYIDTIDASRVHNISKGLFGWTAWCRSVQGVSVDWDSLVKHYCNLTGLTGVWKNEYRVRVRDLYIPTEAGFGQVRQASLYTPDMDTFMDASLNPVFKALGLNLQNLGRCPRKFIKASYMLTSSVYKNYNIYQGVVPVYATGSRLTVYKDKVHDYIDALWASVFDRKYHSAFDIEVTTGSKMYEVSL